MEKREYKQRRIKVLGRKLEQLGFVGGVVKVEVNESAKEKMGFVHAEMNDVGTANEKVCYQDGNREAHCQRFCG